MKQGILAVIPVLVAGALLAAKPTFAADTAVDLELVLTADVSRSIDSYEYDLQREGYARALTHPEVLRAIASGVLRRIAVTYVEWSGDGEQEMLVPWNVIDGEAAAQKFAASLLASYRPFFDGTSVSGAIDHAVTLFKGNGIEGTRRVIDVSGDGPNNRGRLPEEARDAAVRQGITINGLAILNDRPSRAPHQYEEVDVHYRDRVIGGPGAFVITVDGFKDFARGIRRKLVLEIAGRMPPASYRSVRMSHSSGKKRMSSAR